MAGDAMPRRHLAQGHGLGADGLGERAAPAQPAGMSMGLGTSPLSRRRSRRTVGSGTGTADRNARM